MKTIEELELLLAESEASDTGVWEVCRGDEDSDIQDSDGQGIAARVADVDARLIVDMRNALPAFIELVKAVEAYDPVHVPEGIVKALLKIDPTAWEDS